MAQNILQEKRLILKFIVVALKKLVNGPGGTSGAYAKNVDNVFEDICGVKKFGTKFTEAYDDKELMASFARVPMNILYEMCNDVGIYGALADLVMIDARINKINRQIKKKGKKTKSLTKELNYLKDLYKSTAKSIRKKLGLKNGGGSYKKRFQNAVRFSNRSRYDYDDYYDDDSLVGEYIFSDDDHFDDERVGAYQSFKKLYTGGRGKLDDSFYDDFDDDDEDDGDSEGDDRIDALANSVDKLTTIVGKMVPLLDNRGPKVMRPPDNSEVRREFDKMMADDDEEDYEEMEGEPLGETDEPDMPDNRVKLLETAVSGLDRRTGNIISTQNQTFELLGKIRDVLGQLSDDVKSLKTESAADEEMLKEVVQPDIDQNLEQMIHDYNNNQGDSPAGTGGTRIIVPNGTDN